jgi:RHS repeat-associated protein
VTGTINFGRSTAGEVTSITNASYQNLPYNPPNLASNVVNGPDGPVSYTLGNGLNVYRTYDTLGRWQGQWVCNGPAAVTCSGGTQIYGTKGVWQGSQMQSQADTVLGQQIAYGYDGFNRLTSRTVTAGTQQNYTYGYDIYGNRVSQNALQTGYNFLPTINPANNQITTSGYTYDAAGNMTNDTVHSYTYDAEGNITKVDGGSTAQYVYDAFNRRVHVQTASATTEYTYDYAGRRISSWLSPNNTGTEGRIYWGRQQFAYRSSDGTTYFDHQDTLGTERMRTDFGAGSGASFTSLPWGDGYTATINLSGGSQDNEHFAGLERDAESGTEHAQFRNYASVQGRWLAPDSYLGSYDLINPQSMNRYAYVLNNPASFIDPLGLDYQSTPCGTNYDGTPVFCVTTGGSGDGGDIECWWCMEYGGGGAIECWWCRVPPGGGSSSGGGSGTPAPTLGPSRLALLSAPNKSQQTQQQCSNQYNNSAFGKGTQFFSLYNFANNITSLKTWAEWTALPLLKVQAANLISKTAQGIGSTEFLSITSGTATTIVSPTAAGIGATESLGAVAAPIAIGAATVTDIQAHAACAGLYDNQQVMLAPTVF